LKVLCGGIFEIQGLKNKFMNSKKYYDPINRKRISLHWLSALRVVWTPALWLLMMSAVCSFVPSSLIGQIVTTFAGTDNDFADGIGVNARFGYPQDVCTDGAGNLYVTDVFNYRIRKIVIATGEVTTLAGGTNGSADGTGGAAQFSSLKGITSDGSGNLYITESNRIRKIVIATGVVTTLVWGNYITADGKVIERFSYPFGITSDGRGNLYVADAGSNRIQKIVIATGEVTTLAGSTRGTADGVGTAAQFSSPTHIATDGKGNLYVADAENDAVRKVVISTGEVTTQAWGRRLFGLTGMTSDDKGNLYISDQSNDRIRKILVATGEVSIVAGSEEGYADGIGAEAKFNSPAGITGDGKGNLYVVDSFNNRIRKIVITTSTVTTLAGTDGYADGIGTKARLNKPLDICNDGVGNLYVADRDNGRIRKIEIATGVVTTVAGNGGVVGNGGAVSIDGIGINAEFSQPVAITYDGVDNLYVADFYTNRIRKIVITTGTVTTIAGSTKGYANGKDTATKFNEPSSLTTDGKGNLYIADFGNNCIRKIVTATGEVTTFVGSSQGTADGIGTAAQFYRPGGIISDGIGNLYVADTHNHRIRKIAIATREVTTLVGSTRGTADGIGLTAQFAAPFRLTNDGKGNLYVADFSNSRIRKIVIATGEVTTVAGRESGYADGAGVEAKFFQPIGIVSDGANNLYVADRANNRIRRIEIVPQPTAFAEQTPPTMVSVGSLYTYTFVANGTPAPTFSIQSGRLPTGLSLNARTGTLSGKPTEVGEFGPIVIQATNAEGTLNSRPFSIIVNPMVAPSMTSLPNLLVFPNPASDIIYLLAGEFVSTQATAQVQLRVVNSLGAVVQEQKLSIVEKERIELDVHQLSAGLYFIVVTKGTERRSVGFIKQ
jgi:sugar lactone lactonase YvrE